MATASSINGNEEPVTQHILRVSDIAKEPLKMLMPIGGYEDMPLVPLEVAVEPLVSILPAIQMYAYSAIQQCGNPTDGLSPDESASIMLYSMGWTPRDKCLYFALNATLRSKKRDGLELWYLYLKLFLTALSRLPSIRQTIFRGIKLDLHRDYPKDKLIVWWGFSSCTASIDVLETENFLGKTGTRTLFAIDVYSGKDIRNHSYFPTEDEILLPAATQFIVRGHLNPAADLHMIQLQEIQQHAPLLHPISLISEPNKPFSKSGIKSKPEIPVAPAHPKLPKLRRALSGLFSKTNKTRNNNETVNHNTKPELSHTKSESYQNATWMKNASTVAGGSGPNLIISPFGMYVDDDKTIYVADKGNDRITQWKYGVPYGHIVAGGKGKGNGTNQLNYPTDVIVDNERNHLIICDKDNRRILRWPLQNGTDGEIIISNIDCSRLTIDNEGYLYVSDEENHEVRRYNKDGTGGVLVAGGNGQGNRLNQLNTPTFIFVDAECSVYVSDFGNHRVMVWTKDATEGIIVAGGQGDGNSAKQLSGPQGLTIDQYGTVYVADRNNDRIMCWPPGATQGGVVAGGKGQGNQRNQLNYPYGISFDQEENLYVVDCYNDRIQRFDINPS